MSRGRVLVTEDEPSYGVLAGVRALDAAGWEVWVAHAGPGAYTARSRAVRGIVAVPDPSADASAYVEALASAARELGPVAVLPGTEVGLVALAGTDSSFPGGVRLGAPSRPLVERIVDKPAVEQIATEIGLAVPLSEHVARADVPARATGLRYPVVVKSVRTKVRGEGGRMRHGTVRRVDGPEEFLAVAADLPGDELIVQPFLQGALAAVSGVAWEGRVVCVAHQVARRICPPDCGLSAFAETVPPNEALEHSLKQLLRRLEWSGLFQAQFILAGEGPTLIDLNPRMYGSLALAISAGLNLPAIWLELLLGTDPAPGGYRVGARYRAEEKDARAIASAFRRGDLRTALTALVPRRHVTHAAFARRDPLPLLTSLAKVKRLRG